MKNNKLNETIKYALANSDIINQFISSFIKCEILCKELISETNDIKFEDVRLHVTTINNVLKKNGIQYDEDIINKMFSSKLDKINSMSLKFIRDKYLHELRRSCITEIINRNDEIKGIMEVFLSYFDL